MLALLGAASQAQSLFSVAGENSGFGGLVDLHDDGNPAHSQYTDGEFAGSADAAAEYGVLHAYAHAKNLGNGKYSFATATSRFSDELILQKGVGGPAGNTGYFIPTFTIDGTMQKDFGGFPWAGIRYWSDNLYHSGDFAVSSGKHTYTGNFAIPFTYGVAFDFSAQLTAQVVFSGGAYGEGICDFAHTARFTSFDVLDTDGNRINSYSLTSASGTHYGSPVPEPCSLVALATGAVGLLRRKRPTFRK